MDSKLNEWRDYKGLVELQIKGDGSEVRAIKNLQNKPLYYNYKIQKDMFGRRFIKVKHNGEFKTLYVDELVATCCCNPNPTLKYIGHKDGDISNDSYDNLQWVDWNTYLYKFHCNKTKLHNGEIFAWWRYNWYVSEKGYMLIDDRLYNNIYTNMYDSDVDFWRVVHPFIPYNDRNIHIEDGVKAVWNKVILHIDGDFSNWKDTNLKIVDADDPEAKDYDNLWDDWKSKEGIRLFKEKYPNDPIPSFLK